MRILAVAALAVLGHLLVKGAKRISEQILTRAREPSLTARDAAAQRYPKFATITSLVVSALTFLIYFGAVGLVLHELFPRLDLRTYLATAGVVGLAVAFGLQGLIQDVVIGLTLVFSDAFDVGDTIELPGTGPGRVEKMGLRFTILTNFQSQRVYVPNRNIAWVSRFRGGVIRAYVDVQIPDSVDASDVREEVDRLAVGFRAQHRAVLITEHEIFGIFDAGEGGWRYLRLRFRVWPGQGALIENVFRQRVVSAMRQRDPHYADWMVTVTYRVK